MFVCLYQIGHLVLEIQLGLFDCLDRVRTQVCTLCKAAYSPRETKKFLDSAGRDGASGERFHHLPASYHLACSSSAGWVQASPATSEQHPWALPPRRPPSASEPQPRAPLPCRPRARATPRCRPPPVSEPQPRAPPRQAAIGERATAAGAAVLQASGGAQAATGEQATAVGTVAAGTGAATSSRVLFASMG